MSTESAQTSPIEIYIAYLVLHCLIAAFILHNVYKYVHGLKMTQPLITAFYAMILFGQICRIIEYAGFIKYEDTMSVAQP